ncbi:unnamed protein product [Spirodela intermedia]|uniref:Uncharacterized protein n=1 Tax=Spirodela intermedia TaxID=51605 RepID=A0A7I8K4M1_SPIIN|nr:unnamed protein product [Spirodela intermedia]
MSWSFILRFTQQEEALHCIR